MAHNPWIFTFGILGNIFSIMMYISPVPTFFRVYRQKSTEGFQSIPYVVALFSAMLWIYYATLKSNDYLLLSINCFGCFVETIYIAVFIFFAPKNARVLTLWLIFISNFGGFTPILVLTHFLAKGSNRLHIVGWCCVALSAAVFAAPLSIMRLVIRTRSVEFMPFILSLFLSLSAVFWFLYGILLGDIYIALPNIFGVVFGMIQMILYAIYRNTNKDAEKQNPRGQIDNPMKFSSPIKNFEVHSPTSLPIDSDIEVGDQENLHDEDHNRSNNKDRIYTLTQAHPNGQSAAV